MKKRKEMSVKAQHANKYANECVLFQSYFRMCGRLK